MADDKTFTQEQLDAAVAKATGDVEGLKEKVAELIASEKKWKAEARKASEIKPEDMAQLEADNEKLRSDLAAAQKTAKEATATADKATKALEAEQGAARSYALEAEIASAIATGNVVPALIPGFKAMVSAQAKAELIDGKYVVTIGEKPASDAIKGILDSEDGKAWRAASANSGSNALGSNSGSSGKSATQGEVNAMTPKARAQFFEGGGSISQAA